ncbi:MAG: hypothetical protein AB8G18_05640 [Gammaproteobacteria bacterium]
MNTLRCFVGLTVVMMSVGVSALDGVQGDKRELDAEPVVIKPLDIDPMAIDTETVDPVAMKFVPAEPKVEVVLDVPKPSKSQILCLRQKREGSRVKHTKCQTIADWNNDIEIRKMRVISLLKAQGKPVAWE